MMKMLDPHCVSLVLSKLKFWEVSNLAKVSGQFRAMVYNYLIRNVTVEHSLILLPSFGIDDEVIDQLIWPSDSARQGKGINVINSPYPGNYNATVQYAAKLAAEIPFIKYIARTALRHESEFKNVLAIINRGYFVDYECVNEYGGPGPGAFGTSQANNTQNLSAVADDPSMTKVVVVNSITEAANHLGQVCNRDGSLGAPCYRPQWTSWYWDLANEYTKSGSSKRSLEPRHWRTDSTPSEFRKNFIERAINGCFERCFEDVYAILNVLPEIDRQSISLGDLENWTRILDIIASRPNRIDRKKLGEQQ
jgi:hypothetical protein